MTDTRKEFQEWWDVEKKNQVPDYGQDSLSSDIALHSWQACQSLNDKRIQQLLAVIELQLDVLNIVNDAVTHGAGALIKDTLLHKNIENCIAIKPENVELVDALDVSDKEWNRYKSTGEGVKFYTIKTKA